MTRSLAAALALSCLGLAAPAEGGSAPWICPEPAGGTEFSWQGSAGGLSGDWKERRFKGTTRYRVVPSPHGAYLRAFSDASASALYRELGPVPLEGLRLCWSWKVLAFPEGERLDRKEGDDRAAAVTVIFRWSVLPWKVRSLFYVWSGVHPPGTVLENPFARSVRMIVLRQGGGENWVHESRDLAADYRRAFGEESETLEALGVFTDSDNTGGRAEAAYGPFRLARDR